MKAQLNTAILILALCGVSNFINAQSINTPPYYIPGGIDPNSNEYKGSPVDYMGKIDFTAAFRFVSGYLLSGGDPEPEGWSKLWNRNMITKVPMDSTCAGFTIPLVADLDNDGNPEVICMGNRPNNGQDNTNGNYNGIRIFNGKTGQLIDTCIFPLQYNQASGEWGYYHHGYHDVPSPMAIVDADRDPENRKELIMGFPWTHGHPDYRFTVASFEIEPIKTGNVTTGYKFNRKWKSSTYNAETNDNYDRPVTTVVDFNGDGKAEVLVYNKIYSAINGHLLVKMENLGSTAFVGNDERAYLNDRYLGFNYVYDMDKDGIYDVVAGGKIYRITETNNPDKPIEFLDANLIQCPGVPDGRTGVADINGDGKPEVVVVVRPSTNYSTNIRVVVWTPNYDKDALGNTITTGPPDILADVTFYHRRGELVNGADGSNSYVYIGDVDGKISDSGKLFPEICFEALEYGYNASNKLKIHPNVTKLNLPVGKRIPESNSEATSSRYGDMIGLTWDDSPNVPVSERLKLSFVMEHADRSRNTGFTMFDFDNDGIQEICYRDESSLRIISPASQPYIPLNTTDPKIILLKKNVYSFTGFEFPTIADIDNDGSAEMLVMGTSRSVDRNRAFLYVVGNGTGDKFAPALPVWNQAMYDPFKIDPYTLRTPLGPAPDRLSTDYEFTRIIRDGNGNGKDTIVNYNPFNGTLLQATKINLDSLNAKYGKGYEPVSFLTEVYIDGAKIKKIGSKQCIEFTIGNRGNSRADVSPNLPVKIYKNNTVSLESSNVHADIYLKDLLNETATAALGTNFTIAPGESRLVHYEIVDTLVVYVIRLGDDSKLESGTPVWRFGYNQQGGAYDGLEEPGPTGQSSRAFRDGYWGDQIARAAKPQLFNDFATVQELRSVGITPMKNDIIVGDTVFLTGGNKFDPIRDSFRLQDSCIIRHPRAGYLTFDTVKGPNNVITYHHADSVPLTHGIDSFQYRLWFIDPTKSQKIEPYTAWVYIYVLQSAEYGFTSCADATNKIELAVKQAGTRFEWRNARNIFLQEGATRTQVAPQKSDSTYYIKPILSNVTSPWFKAMSFPIGELFVPIIVQENGSYPKMQWTGAVSTNWRDPNNWEKIVLDASGKPIYTAPVKYIPAKCTDVIIPTSVEHYPELKNSKEIIHYIQMKDRAQLKNPHALVYDSAWVEFKIKPEEKDRFLMWSPPLMEMYSGDYHLLNINTNVLEWSDTYMSYFNLNNPADNYNRNSLTGTVANPLRKFKLGDAFNLKVISTAYTRNDTLKFPIDENIKYPDTQSGSMTLTKPSRDNYKRYRFITDTVKLTDDKSFNLPVDKGWPPAGNSPRPVLVTNPYLAYLDFEKFKDGNTILNGYYLWRGKPTEGFLTVIDVNSNNPYAGYRYGITPSWLNTTISANPKYIPPLQSFFVLRNDDKDSVKMSPEYTTTIPPEVTTYSLRSDEAVPGLLSMRLSHGENSDYAAIVHNDAASAILDKFDMPVLTFDEIPLSLYTFANGEALTVNSIDHFGLTTSTMKIGLQVREAGEYTLSFDNIAAFGYNVALIDDERRGEKFDLAQKPDYTFHVTKPASGYAEINNRFSLEFTPATKGTAIESVTHPSILKVTGENSLLDIRSLRGEITSVQVYDVLGKLVYNNVNVGGDKVRVPVESGRLYLIRATISGETITEKIIVR
jgi:hypothetical protein